MKLKLFSLVLVIVFIYNDVCITKDQEKQPLLPSNSSSTIQTIINILPYNDATFVISSYEGYSFYSTKTGEALNDKLQLPKPYSGCIEGYYNYMGKVSNYYFYNSYLLDNLFFLNNNYNHESIILDEYGSLCVVSNKIFKSDKTRINFIEYYIHVIPKNYKSWYIKCKLDTIGSYSLHPILIEDTLFLEIGKNLYLYSMNDGKKLAEIIDFNIYVNNYSFNENYILYKGNLFSRADTRFIASIGIDIFDNILKLENDKIIGCTLDNDYFYANIFDLKCKIYKRIKLDVLPYSYPNNTIQPTQLLGIGKDCLAYNDWSLRSIGIKSFENKSLFSFNYYQEEAKHIKAFMAGSRLIVKTSGGIFSFNTDLNKIEWVKNFQDGFYLIGDDWYFYNQVDIDNNQIISNSVFRSINSDVQFVIPYFDKNSYRIKSDKNSVYMFDINPNPPNVWPIQFTTDNSKRKNVKMSYSWRLDYTCILDNRQYCIMRNQKTNITKTFIQRGNGWEIDNNIPSYQGVYVNDNNALVTLTDNHIFIYIPKNENSLSEINKFKDYKNYFKINITPNSILSDIFLWKNNYIVIITKSKLMIYDYKGSVIFDEEANYLINDKIYIFYQQGTDLNCFDGLIKQKVVLSEYNTELFLNNTNKIIFSNNSKIYSQFSIYDFSTNTFFQMMPEKLSINLTGDVKLIDAGENGFLLFPSFVPITGDYAKYSEPIIFSPCSTFSMKKQLVDNKIELTIKNTTNKNLENPLAGKIRIMPYGADGKPPIFHEFDKQTIEVPSLKSGESAKISIPLPEMKTLDDQLNMIDTNYFALIIESNGLLDTKNSELSGFDKEGRPLFDGVPTSLEKQQAIVVTVWKK